MRKNLPQIIACIFAALVVGAQIAWSQDATVTIEPPEPGLWDEMQPVLIDLGILALGALITGITGTKYFKKMGMPKRLLFQAVAAGVQHAFLNYVKPTKAKQGGKLTEPQKERAREIATDHAIETAEALGVQEPLTREMVEPLVQEQVRQVKTDAIAIDNHKRVRKGRHVGIGS